jgi:hypothetical protein
MSLVWALVAATATASAIVSIGAALSVVSLAGGGLDPNPYIAASLLLGGSVLMGTLLKIVRGDGTHG